MSNNVAPEETPIHPTNAYALPHAERKGIKEAKIEAEIEEKLPEAILITDNNPSDNYAEIIQSTEASSSKYIKASEESNDEKIIKDILNNFSNGLKTNAEASDRDNVLISYGQIKVAKDSFINNLKENQETKKKDVFKLHVFTEKPIEDIFKDELDKIISPQVEKKSLVGSLFSSKKKTIYSTIFENDLAGENCSPDIQIRLPNKEIKNIFCIAKKIYKEVIKQQQIIDVDGGKNKKTKKRRKKQQKTKKKKTKQKKTKKKKTKRFSHNILKKRH